MKLFFLLFFLFPMLCIGTVEAETKQLSTLKFDHESAWIVGSITEEIIRTLLYASPHHSGLEDVSISVVTKPTDKQGSHFDIAIQGIKPSSVSFTNQLTIPDSIWNPDAYLPLTQKLIQECAAQGLSIHQSHEASLGGWPLKTLPKFKAGIIQQENERISAWLKEHPLDAQAHEQAALVLGTLGMRENSGVFFNPMVACNKVTAHLALAKAIEGSQSAEGINGQVAELLVGLLIDTKADCEDRIGKLKTQSEKNPELAPWIQAAVLRNTRDFRTGKDPEVGSLLERVELFRALAEAVTSGTACQVLAKSVEEPLTDWHRIVLELNCTVQQGHRFAEPAINQELAEAASIFPASFNKEKLSASELSDFYNQLPGHTIETQPDGTCSVQVIDNGLWASYFQRHLCNQIAENYAFLQSKWGVPEEAASLKNGVDALFGGMRLYPLIAMAANNQDWIREQDAAVAKLINEYPEMVPITLWKKYLDGKSAGALSPTLKRPEGWFVPGIPPGTAFCFQMRVDALPELSKMSEEQAAAFENIAPWRYEAAYNFYLKQAHGEKNPALYQKILGRFLDYYRWAMIDYCEIVKDNPDEYIATMNKLAMLEPSTYLALGHYLVEHHRDEDAAKAYEAAYQSVKQQSGDAVAFSNASGWLVNYYYDHGEKEKALEVANYDAEVYSAMGLEIMAKLMEKMNRLEDAETYFKKIEERYDDPSSLNCFYARQYAIDPHSPHGQKYKIMESKIFPEGERKVKLTDLSAPPTDGVLINGSNGFLTKSGLKEGEIIVALNGIQVHNYVQYSYIRGMLPSDQMNFIVYGNGSFREVSALVPGRRFGVDFPTYSTQPNTVAKPSNETTFWLRLAWEWVKEHL